ncbi:MAG: hypothetical protein JRH16_11010 [Deltaproteobacteria bacterium]|nr:hypothetical protein [Deltaproteobacteria bacterium]MBW2361986.1 hypothetical protein [Deltaproteobacteria bacterium]
MSRLRLDGLGSALDGGSHRKVPNVTVGPIVLLGAACASTAAESLSRRPRSFARGTDLASTDAC